MYDDDVVRCTLTFTHFLAGFVPYLRPSLVNYSDLKLTECSKRGRTRVREYSTSVRSTCFFFFDENVRVCYLPTNQRFNDSNIFERFCKTIARRKKWGKKSVIFGRDAMPIYEKSILNVCLTFYC